MVFVLANIFARTRYAMQDCWQYCVFCKNFLQDAVCTASGHTKFLIINKFYSKLILMPKTYISVIMLHISAFLSHFSFQ